MLQVAPGRSDLAAATVSAAVNVGITGGAFAGGLALTSHGVHSTVLIGALLSAVAVVVALSERLNRPAGPGPVHPPPVPGPAAARPAPVGPLRAAAGSR